VVPFPDHLQALERQVLVDDLQVARALDDHVRLPASGDGLGFGAELGDDALQDAIDHADGAEVEAALHAGHRVGAHHVLGRPEIHQRQAGGFGEQGGDGDADADRDGPTEVFAVFRNHVEVDGGAHIDNHARAAVFTEAGDGVDQAVGAHFAGVVVAYGEPDIGARRDEHGFRVEVAFGHERQGGIDGRHDARNDDAIDPGDIQAGRGEEIAQQYAPLVGGLLLDRAQAPVENQVAAFESADGDIAVTCVKSQQHVRLLQESGYRFHRPGARGGTPRGRGPRWFR